jgi:3-phosphoshikimate 1-carboxyvinyltransferase
MNKITLHPTHILNGTAQHLPASKSISNRALILHALSGGIGNLHNLSSANDTVVMQRLLSGNQNLLNVEDAGTVMRFLTAYFAIGSEEKILTGTPRMQERPIGILVEALRAIGANIQFEERDGYPPLKISRFTKQLTNRIAIKGDVSSQFISALMMVATQLPDGLHLELTGKVGSRPYIEMTASLMRKFGAQVFFEGNSIHISNQALLITEYTIEGDWSAASYWFAFVALCKEAEILLPNMHLRSLQGDKVIIDIMENLGVACEPRGDKLLLRKKDWQAHFSYDFSDCPDLAQTVAVVCAAKGITGEFAGLESLRIKETDRIQALQNELAKIDARLEENNAVWRLTPSSVLPKKVAISTYHDHRMAMAFAPLAAVMEVEIEEPNVTRKSYPEFWQDLQSLGVQTKL